MKEITEKSIIIIIKETNMEFILNIIQRVLFFEKEPQKIGLTQLKESPKIEQTAPSIKSKDIKLSDLMRRPV